MSLTEVMLTEKPTTLPQKEEAGGERNGATSLIEFEDICAVDWNDLEEVPSQDWELGGLSMTTETLRALFAGE